MLLSDHRLLRAQFVFRGRNTDGSAPVTAGKAIVLHGSRARLSLRHVSVGPGGRITLRLKLTAPGQLRLRALARKTRHDADDTQASGRWLKIAGAHTGGLTTRTVTLRLAPNATGRGLLADSDDPYRLEVTITYTPLDARPQTVTIPLRVARSG
jgi:hypothetical protein